MSFFGGRKLAGSGRALLLLISAALLGSGCSNGISKILNLSTNLAKSSSGDPLSGIISPTPNQAFTIIEVFKDGTNPGALLDVMGPPNATDIGNLCTPVSSNTSSTPSSSGTNLGASTCSCQLRYTVPGSSGGTPRTNMVEVPTSYHEQNLIRCPYSAVPAAAMSVQVVIHVLTTDSYSNPLTYTFNGGNQNQLDPSLQTNFARVTRYQCRDLVWVPNLFDGNIYDPFQSEDPRYTYPLNFYTTNFGGTIEALAGGANGVAPPIGWNCPANPLLDDPLAAEAAGLVPNLYSVAPDHDFCTDPAGCQQIYPVPPNGLGSDRHTFYLAIKPTGVFTVPVNAYIAPTIHSAALDSQGNPNGPPPIGYGALPVIDSSGNDTCPSTSDVVIPAGYEWVKVWLFRMALPARSFVFSQKIQNMADVACAPGEFGDAANVAPNDPGNSYPPDCFKAPYTNAAGTNIFLPPALDLPRNHSLYLSDTSSDPTLLASRFLTSTLMCMNMSGHSPIVNGGSSLISGPGGTTATDNGGQPILLPFLLGSGFDYALGTDVWEPNNKDGNYGCNGNVHADPGGVCGPGINILPRWVDNTGANTPSNTSNQNATLNPPAGPFIGWEYPPGKANFPFTSYRGAVPYDPNPTMQPWANELTTPRFDFLFVVTPPTVTTSQMLTSQAIHDKYTPFRYTGPNDCNSANPDRDATCQSNLAYVLRNYGMKFHDVGTLGDPPPDDPSRPGVFPVCAVRPKTR